MGAGLNGICTNGARRTRIDSPLTSIQIGFGTIAYFTLYVPLFRPPSGLTRVYACRRSIPQ